MATPDSPLIGAATATCPDTATPCGNLSTELMCDNGGVCCVSNNREFCACPDRWKGEECTMDYMYVLLEALQNDRDKSMKVIGLSSAISIFVGLIALVALGIIAYVLIRSSRKRRFWGLQPVDPEKDLDKTIVFVQEEISKLSTVQQLNKLHRLSKLFEKTVREAILSEPGHREERPKSVAMNEYLPRWSSAPTCLNRPPNDLDTIDGLEDDVFQHPRPKLQQVFSLQ